MMKLNILNMKNFLKVVNECRDEVRVILPDGQKKKYPRALCNAGFTTERI